MDNYRVNNIELRKTKRFIVDNNNDDSHTYYWEVVYWYKNPDYMQENKYVWDEQHQMYKDPIYNYYKSVSCFKHPESCYTLIIFKESNDDEPDMVSVGGRPADLDNNDWQDLLKVLNYYYSKYRKNIYNNY